jgi:hypothetical protein
MESSSDTLKSIFAPGDSVPVIIRSVSRSGMSRTIDVIDPHNLQTLNSLVSDVTGFPRSKTEFGVVLGGYGEDKRFRLVYELGRALYGDGYALTYNEL